MMMFRLCFIFAVALFGRLGSESSSGGGGVQALSSPVKPAAHSPRLLSNSNNQQPPRQQQQLSRAAVLRVGLLTTVSALVGGGGAPLVASATAAAAAEEEEKTVYISGKAPKVPGAKPKDKNDVSGTRKDPNFLRSIADCRSQCEAKSSQTASGDYTTKEDCLSECQDICCTTYEQCTFNIVPRM